ncbi:Ig-like domain-containing protein, partial [Candidatus Borrarchaeum sp.]|uniref:Ig-like domain-containing protein n=1 Tax=Candidatus Borrarchaeum sp. TaxID=2846742 RepID=UPI00257F8EE8
MEIISPLDNSTVFGNVKIEVNAEAYHEIYRVTLSINEGTSSQMDKINGNSQQGKYVYVWNTQEIPDGTYELNVQLIDTFGHTTQKQITVYVKNVFISTFSSSAKDSSNELVTDSNQYHYLSFDQISETGFIVETEEIEETFNVIVEKTEREEDRVLISGVLSFNGPLPDAFWFNVTGDTGQLLNYKFNPEIPEDAILQITENEEPPLIIKIDGNAINEQETYLFELYFENDNEFNGKIKVGTGTTVVLVYEAQNDPTIDGTLTSGEWDGAYVMASDWKAENGGASPTFDIAAYIMQNSTHVLVAFNISDAIIVSDPYGDYAVVYFDVNNDAPPPQIVGDPAIDDHGYGIVRTPTGGLREERQGIGTSTGREGWDDSGKWRYWDIIDPPSAAWKSGFFDDDTYWSIELAIPFSELGVTSQDVIGIKCLYGESATETEFAWPPGGGDPGEPVGDLDAEDDTASYGDAYLDIDGPIVWNVTVSPQQAIEGTLFTFT